MDAGVRAAVRDGGPRLHASRAAGDRGGSGTLAGLALLTYCIPSFIIRPFFGRMADRSGGSYVLAIGLLMMTAGGLVYLGGAVWLIFVAAALRGAGLGGVTVGGFALLADGAPESRRGEAAGYFSSATNSTVIFFPAAGLWLLSAPAFGFNGVFVASVCVAAAGLVITMTMLRRELPAVTMTPDTASRTRGDWLPTFDRAVMVPTVLNLSVNLATPAVIAFLPLYARELDLGDVSAFYLLAGVGSVIIRPVIGKASDSIGRGRVLVLGLAFLIVGLLLVLFAETRTAAIAGGFLVALGHAVPGAATTALAMDMAPAERRGQAMGAFSMSFQIGQGFGAILAGALIDIAGPRSMYAGSLVIVAIACVMLAANWRTVSPRRRGPLELTG